MARNLEQAGLLAAAWNRSAARAQGLLKDPERLVATPQAVAECSDLIIISVSRDADVLEVVQSIKPALRAHAIVADTSTVSGNTARRMAASLAEVGASFLDCPVSGGVEGAVNGTLAMMVGGDADALQRAEPALSQLTSRIVHIGGSGAGQEAKALNQLMAAGINQAVTEALAFGQQLGLDMDRVLAAVSHGAAANWFLQHRGQSMLDGVYKPGFRVRLHYKDLEIISDMAAEHGMQVPILDMTLADYKKLIAAGHGDDDISALFRLKKRNSNATSGQRPMQKTTGSK